MKNAELIKRFDEVLAFLPPKIAESLFRFSDEIKLKTEEIRLRAGRPLALTISGETVFAHSFCKNPKVFDDKIFCLSEKDIEESFFSLCGGSVYSHIEELCEGFIILPNGHRAGVCGSAVLKDGKITSIKDISSLNIRLAKEVFISCEDILKGFERGILVCGPPGSGKTTLLRNLARSLASGEFGKPKRVAVIDSRGEIAGAIKGIPTANLGAATDVLTAYPKEKGIEIALRTLFPDVIVFDEIGNEKEVRGVLSSVNSGVKIITTAHLSRREDLYKRSQTEKLISSGAIDKLVFCDRKNGFNFKTFFIDTKRKGLICDY